MNSSPQLDGCPSGLELLGDPLPDPRQPLPASRPLPLRGGAEAQLVEHRARRPVAGLPFGRLRCNLRAGPPLGPRSRIAPPPHVFLGTIRAGSPRRAGHHHRILQAR